MEKNKPNKVVDIVGAGLAGSEAALQLANRGYFVRLFEMRPSVATPVHKTDNCAELVCSNSLKSTKPESAAGMLKYELTALGSVVLSALMILALRQEALWQLIGKRFLRQLRLK